MINTERKEIGSLSCQTYATSPRVMHMTEALDLATLRRETTLPIVDRIRYSFRHTKWQSRSGEHMPTIRRPNQRIHKLQDVAATLCQHGLLR